MISACLNGQTGPHKDYPGFGGQGSALVGLQLADRLARPRAGRPARHDHRLARAALRRHRARRRPALPAPHRSRRLPRRLAGRGRDLHARRRGCSTTSSTASTATRDGNRSPRAVPHGAFPCADEGDVGDRWVAIACWTDDEWARLAPIVGLDDPRSRRSTRGRPGSTTSRPRSRRGRATRTRIDVAEQLQAARHRGGPGRGLRRRPRRPAGRARASTSSRSTHPFLGAASTSATASGSPTHRAATTAPGRPSARTTTGCSASSSASRRRAGAAARRRRCRASAGTRPAARRGRVTFGWPG